MIYLLFSKFIYPNSLSIDGPHPQSGLTPKFLHAVISSSVSAIPLYWAERTGRTAHPSWSMWEAYWKYVSFHSQWCSVWVYCLNLHHRYTHAFNSMMHCYLVLTICICVNQQLATVIKLERMAHLAVNSVDSVNANPTLLVGAVIPVLLWHMGLGQMAAHVSHIIIFRDDMI